MEKIALTLFLCIGVCHSTQPIPEFDDKWELYKINFQKAYSNSTEELERRLTWEDNIKYIQDHNSAADNGTYSYWLETNHLSDLTIDQVVEQRTGINIPANTTSGTTFTPQNTGDMPDTVDWRTMGYVTPVKNQGSCGSCWAFSATGALEGQNKAVNDILLSLSEQDLVDCSNSNNGCHGGWPAHAFLDIRKAGGIDTESTYPYNAKKGACRFSQNNIGAYVSGYNSTRSGDENNLKLAVAFVGPVSVCIIVTRNFQSYRSGVLNDPNCNEASNVNHAVLVVGYGVYKGQDYWLVKNSWGTGWGMNGYILMSRNKNNQCSIATYGVFPKVQPSETKSSNHGQALEVSFQKLLVLSGVVYLSILHFYI